MQPFVALEARSSGKREQRVLQTAFLPMASTQGLLLGTADTQSSTHFRCFNTHNILGYHSRCGNVGMARCHRLVYGPHKLLNMQGALPT